MDARELDAVGTSGGPVRISVVDADGGDVVFAGADGRSVRLTSFAANVFRALLDAPAPLDLEDLKRRAWKKTALSEGRVYNVISGVRKALSPIFADPIVTVGNPALYTLNIGPRARAPAASDDLSADAFAPLVWPARLIVCATQALCCQVTAGLVLQSIDGNKGAGIILATGRTAGEVFHAATAMAKARRFLGLELAHYFIDKEVLGIGPGHEVSRHAFVRREFIEPLRAAGYRIGEERVKFFRGAIDNDERTHFHRFRHALKALPIAMHLLSVSPQGGVIGYSRPAKRALQDILRDDCEMTFLSADDYSYIGKEMPSPSMLSIGASNLLRPAELIIPVYHAAKAAILRAVLSADHADPAIPATWVRLHPRATVITTAAMAGEAGERDGVIRINNPGDAVARLGVFVG